MSAPEINALKGLGAIFAGLAAIGASVAASYGYAYSAIVAGGLFVVAGAMLITTALAARGKGTK